MKFEELITQMTQAAAQGNAAAVASCFAEDGVYHDCFYGSFRGREKITEMVEAYFHDPVSSGDLGYVRYVFSYTSKLEESFGKRVLFEGVCICKLKDGLLVDYREVANAAVGLHMMEFPPQRLAKLVGREAQELSERMESAHHIKPQLAR
jgi:hypothetical protein